MRQKRIRQGLNSRNIEYWTTQIFMGMHHLPEGMAKLNAHRVCGEQEIAKLKERIIKLEKKIKKLDI